MKKKVLPIIIVLAIAFGVIAFKPSLAWLSSSFNKTQKVDVGALNYTFDNTVSLNASYTDGSSNTYATPGENLLYVSSAPGTLKIYNLSTITTNLRIRIDYTFYDTTLLPTAGFVVVPFDTRAMAVNDFDVKDSAGARLGASSSWVYDGGYWNYKDPRAPIGAPYEIPAYVESTTAVTTSGETTTGATTTTATTGGTTTATISGDAITLINSLGYSSLLGNNSPYKDQPVTVKLTVQVKQADYVDWATIATIIA